LTFATRLFKEIFLPHVTISSEQSQCHPFAPNTAEKLSGPTPALSIHHSGLVPKLKYAHLPARTASGKVQQTTQTDIYKKSDIVDFSTYRPSLNNVLTTNFEPVSSPVALVES
jgi:hypothetical protein